MTTSPTPDIRARRISRLLAPALWPLVILVVVHRTWALPLRGVGTTDDFTTVWTALTRFVDGNAVYTAIYEHTYPHYLYSPGGTLLLSPVTWLGEYDTARLWFTIAQSAGIIIGVLLLLRLVGVDLRSWITPAVLAAVFATESVTNTLAFTNVNGTLFMAQALFLVLLLKDKRIAAGLVIGIALTIKPIVAPLLFLPFVRKDWSTILTALAVPVVANIVAWPMMADSSAYLERTIPYLGVVRDYANASLSGQLTWYGAPDLLVKLWLIAFAAPVILSLILLLRWQWRDEVFWALTTSGALMTGVFLLGSLGQQYYSMLLLPTVFTIFRAFAGRRDAQGDPVRTVMANWPAGLAVALFFLNADWFMEDMPLGSSWWTGAMAPLGWILFCLTIVGCLIKWTIEEHGAGYDWLGRKGATSFFGARGTSRPRADVAPEDTAAVSTAPPQTERTTR
ncbi:glycosyltransferase family 87 protein [uncultured Corynebacterium sp.]|uniref:glycosyltransferase family 87 protein n=1 Tax=uncultured Corynebacterium sp. TaxID=159447 RepID=UPI0025E5389F|nr:glycosyltransferase family 87 protein [uncultured Corynebacterium sp.]